ncbi:hypothetical protein KR009_001082, partial [Drosophila setifemur]
IKSLYMVLPWRQGEQIEDTVAFQLVLDDVLFQLEFIVQKQAISFDSEGLDDKSTEPSLEILSDTARLRNAEVRGELETIGSKLLLLRQQTLTCQALINQQRSESKLVEERIRAEALRSSLSKTKLKLRLANAEKSELMKAFKLLKRKYRAHREHQSLKKVNTIDESKVDTKTLTRRRMPQDQKVLKDILEVPEIEEEENQKICKRKPTKRPKFPESGVRWRYLCGSLQKDLLTMRLRWRRMNKKLLRTESKLAIGSSVEQQTSRSSSSRKKDSPINRHFDPEFWWDKIYKPTSQETPADSVADSSEVNRSCARKLPTIREVITPVPSSMSLCPSSTSYNHGLIVDFPGITFGDRRRILLKWCQEKTRPYGLPMYEFSASWTSGRALCAIIHAYHPQLIAPPYLRSLKPIETLKYGVSVAKSLGLHSNVNFVQECSQKKPPKYERVLQFVMELHRCLESQL